jgi:hypothetical protein
MDMLERLKLRTGEADENILLDCMESAKAAIQTRRYPFGDWPDELEPRYNDLQYRIALDLYNKSGAEGEKSHSENGIARTYESSWVSEQLLSEVVPKVVILT